jgi:ParB family chromosome partitioning protein
MSSVKKKGLGRGLEALLGSNESSVGGSSSINVLKLDQLQAGKYQPRQMMQDQGLNELAQSIQEQGVMQPLLVRPISAGKYEIIAGERRYRAAKLAGLKEVPVLVKTVDDQATAAMALIENIQREDLNPLEEAQGLGRLIEEFGYTHEQAAKAVGKSRSAVSNLLRLTQLAKAVQAMLLNGDIDMGHARALLPLAAAQQVALAQKIAAQGLSVREAERLATKMTLTQNGKSPSKTSISRVDNPDLKRIETNLSDKFNLPIEIKSKGSGGEIRIKFSQFDELDGLFKQLGVE